MTEPVCTYEYNCGGIERLFDLDFDVELELFVEASGGRYFKFYDRDENVKVELSKEASANLIEIIRKHID